MNQIKISRKIPMEDVPYITVERLLDPDFSFRNGVYQHGCSSILRVVVFRDDLGKVHVLQSHLDYDTDKYVVTEWDLQDWSEVRTDVKYHYRDDLAVEVVYEGKTLEFNKKSY